MERLAVQRATPQTFAQYGSVVSAPTAAPTAHDATFRYWSDVARYSIDGETEIGLCTVVRQDAPRVAWMERHARTPEILVPLDGPLVLPVMADDGAVEAFRVAQGEAVVIADGVWHSACLPAEAASATYLVVFRRGTPQEDIAKRDAGPFSIDR